jgi:hypothetical protein
MSSRAVPALLRIRPFAPAEWPRVWPLLEPVFRAGETFPHDPAITEDEGRVLWVDQTQAVVVAVDAAGAVVGTYLVVCTNTAGIRCWKSNGFHSVGALPRAFRHRQLGDVDALVMLQGLVVGPAA